MFSDYCFVKKKFCENCNWTTAFISVVSVHIVFKPVMLVTQAKNAFYSDL